MNAMNGTFDRSNANALTFDEAKHSDVMADSQKGHQSLVEWLDKMLPYLKLSLEASAEELRMCLMDGTVLCSLLNQLSPGSIRMGGSYEPAREKLERFLTAMDEMTLPRFELSDLEKGDMAPVLQSLKALKASFYNGEFDRNLIYLTRSWSMPKEVDQSKVQETNFDEVFYTSISDARILELMKSMKSSNFQNASTQSLFDMLNKILDESTERVNGNVSHGVASILRTIVQVAEQRVSTQAENLKNQNILFRIREEKYRSRIKVLEMLATGTTEENEIVTNRLEHVKIEKAKSEEKEKLEGKDVIRLTKEKDRNDNEISKLKQELEVLKKAHEKQCSELEARAEKSEVELEKKLDKLEICLDDSRKRVKELENFWESRSRNWEKKESSYRSFMSSHSTALQDLKGASESIRLEVLKTQKSYYQDFNYFGLKLRLLGDAAKNYQLVLEENRRLYNEVQDLKGNIRVYCRIKPFLPGQNKETTIEYIGENGELVIVNPLKQGKDNHRLFKFKKVFGPTASQEEVFLDTRPLVRSVLDGFNVCIFAYGQTGSGKTYTMSGPSISSEQDWGVNYRALNDLFQMSQSRLNSITYEVGVQMIEIYNEQVRDLLSNGGSQRSLGIRNIPQPDGIAVPDAIMHSVKSTEDVVELMNIGSRNRAVSATVLNERSSRSHSVLTVHVRGMDMDTDSVLRGSLHLVDLAGSERVERSEATGDRLKEAQHINKSLSALGDVISALAQKGPHVPYRNSKLTQVLQSSLGGQAKTLMFVQITPEVDSYSETISTLKFAERVSGVELGAARSNKEGRDIRRLMDQVSSLKDMVSKRDEQIEKYQQLKGNVRNPKRGFSYLRQESSSPRRYSVSATPQGRGKGSTCFGRSVSNYDSCSRYSDKQSEAGSLYSAYELRSLKDSECRNLNEDMELFAQQDGDSDERLSDISDGCLSRGAETEASAGSAAELTIFPETTEPAEIADKSENPKNVVKAKKSEKQEKDQTSKKANTSEHNGKVSLPSKPMTTTPRTAQARPSRLSFAANSSSKVLTGVKKTTNGSSSSLKPFNRQR